MPAKSADVKWLEKAEHWGEWKRVPDDKPGAPESIWLLKGSNGNARFYAKGKGQVGPEHKSLVAATYWAWGNRWLWAEPDGSIDLPTQLGCRQWVSAGGA